MDVVILVRLILPIIFPTPMTYIIPSHECIFLCREVTLGTVNNIGTQSFIGALSYSLTLGTFIVFLLFGSELKIFKLFNQDG